MIKNNIKWLLIASLSIVACSKDDETTDEVPVTAGSADFSKYVALGDSFAAGFSDNALFKTAQQTSYPAILAGQFSAAGGGSFSIPYMNDDVGGLLLGGNPIQGKRLYYTGNTASPVATVSGNITTEVTNHLSGTFNNLGVPGAKSYHLLAAGYGNTAGVATGTANPYYARFSSSTTSTVVGDALAQNPTFFSLWIGGNDVLGYALSGGTGANHNTTGNTNPASYGSSDITNNGVFNTVYNGIVSQLTAGGKKGVVANLPYITTLPQFTTVPYNPLTSTILGGAANITALNTSLYGPLKAALSQPACTAVDAQSASRINLLSTTSPNPLLIKDEGLANLAPQLIVILQAAPFNMSAAQAGLFAAAFGQARQATSSDLVLLTTQSAIGTAPTAADSGLGFAPPAPLNKFGVTFPLQDKHVLIPSEISEIKLATDSYNTTIQAAATANGLAFFDAKSIMSQLASGGIVESGYTVTTAFVTGAGFSLDGVHPSPRGYALIANQFIKAINDKYGSTLKPVNIGTYRVLFPAQL